MGCKSQMEKPMRKHKRGLWSPEEDQRLRNYILRHGINCWNSVPANALLQRNGKSCRLRWINYLRPGLKRGVFSSQEEEMILSLHKNLGNKWSQIAKQLPGRTDNEIKNHWHSYLKKRAAKSNETDIHVTPKLEQKDSSCSIIQEKKVLSGVDSTLESTINTDNQGPSMSSIDQELQQAGYQSLLPKLVFADWLTANNNSIIDHVHQPSSSRDNNEDYMHGFAYNNEISSSSSCINIENFGHDENLHKGMLDIPFTYHDQTSLADSFIALSADNVVYSGF